jgi:probable rRNA maturation factor
MTARRTGSRSKTASTHISLRNLQRKTRVDVAGLQNFTTKALRKALELNKKKKTNLRKLHEVFVCLISDPRMASLHRKFMRQTGPTDVLTFQHGEIFISVDTARRNARSFRNSLERELCLYIVHGLLHLHGFDDQTQAGARQMERIQEKILSDCSGGL